MSYIQSNRWFVTASKLKTFLRNPEEYKLQYIDEIELENEEEKRHFVIWTAFDDLVSYGKDFFLDKYAITEKYLKGELVEKAVAKWEIDKKIISKWNMSQLRQYLFPNRDESKIILTPAEGRDIMGMYEEVCRQPIADIGAETYQKQFKVECEYKWLKLRWTLDRVDLERWLIRDRKTSWRIDHFEYDMENTFDYVMSMAFYYILVKVKHEKECDVILDVIGKKAPYIFIGYKIEKKRLLEKAISKIIPWLEALIQAYETDTRLPVDPLTWWPIPRQDMMKSPYYNYMTWSIQKNFLDPTL